MLKAFSLTERRTFFAQGVWGSICNKNFTGESYVKMPKFFCKEIFKLVGRAVANSSPPISPTLFLLLNFILSKVEVHYHVDLISNENNYWFHKCDRFRNSQNAFIFLPQIWGKKNWEERPHLRWCKKKKKGDPNHHLELEGTEGVALQAEDQTPSFNCRHLQSDPCMGEW